MRAPLTRAEVEQAALPTRSPRTPLARRAAVSVGVESAPGTQRSINPASMAYSAAAQATRQKYQETPSPLLQGAAVPLLDGASSKQPADEEGVANLDVEGGAQGDGAPPKKILYGSCVLILAYLVTGILYGRLSAGWSLVDSMYFVAVTVTTVGYGDLNLQKGSDLAKIGGGIYVFVGVLIISAAAGVILGTLQAKAEVKFRRVIVENERKMLEKGGGTHEFDLEAEKQAVFKDVSKGLIFVGIALVAGCTGMMYFQDDWSFSDAFYFCCVTMTTVGYGDLVPTSDGAKVFVTLYILFAFAVLASMMAEVGAVPFRIEELKKIHKCLNLLGNSLDSKELRALCGAEEIVAIRNEQQLANAKEDPYVSRSEFAIWQLVKQGKLEMEEVLQCMQTFDKLDADGSGRLNQGDIDLFLQREQDSFQGERN